MAHTPCLSPGSLSARCNDDGPCQVALFTHLPDGSGRFSLCRMWELTALHRQEYSRNCTHLPTNA